MEDGFFLNAEFRIEDADVDEEVALLLLLFIPRKEFKFEAEEPTGGGVVVVAVDVIDCCCCCNFSK